LGVLGDRGLGHEGWERRQAYGGHDATLNTLAGLARALKGGHVVAAIIHGLSQGLCHPVDFIRHCHHALHGAWWHRYLPGRKPLQGQQQIQDEDEQSAHDWILGRAD